MRDEYDFSEGVKNPYVRQQKTTVTIRLDIDKYLSGRLCGKAAQADAFVGGIGHPAKVRPR